MNEKAIAIIPARGGSKRIPRKNIAPLNGRPMISYAIETAIKCNAFDQVFVSTEDDEITAIAHNAGARTFRRSEEFATDTAHELDACAELLESIQKKEGTAPGAFCVIYPTAVLITPEDLEISYKLLEGPPESDVVMSVSGYNYHPYKALVKNPEGYLEMMFPVECKQRSQTYPHVTASNGTFYWLRTESFCGNRGKGYYQERLTPYEIPFQRAIDIDYPEDLEQAERALKFYEEIK